MEIDTNINGVIRLKKIYNTILLETNDSEEMWICMRDSGFEFTYEGVLYSAQNGKITNQEEQ